MSRCAQPGIAGSEIALRLQDIGVATPTRRKGEHNWAVTQAGQPGRSDPADVARFFESRRTAAVLKHGKTGSASADHKVVIVDGYAGAGRYDDGSPGSPELIVQALSPLNDRDMTCYFVERDQTTFDSLCAVLAQLNPGPSVKCVPLPGRIEDRFDELLAGSKDIPLFVFLDPLGFGLPFERIAHVFDSRPVARYSPATEVMFRIDSRSIFRTRGALLSDAEYPGKVAQLGRLDDTAGDHWWRDPAMAGLDTSRYLSWFIDELFQRLRQRTKADGWKVELRHDPDHLPAYYLIFLTRHPAGMDVFSACLSSAQEEWRRAVFDEQWRSTVGRNRAAGQFGLFGLFGEDDPDAEFGSQESARVAAWTDTLAANLRLLVTEHSVFVVRDKQADVLKGVAGLVREKHIRAAMNVLKAEGLIVNDSRGDMWSKRVVRVS